MQSSSTIKLCLLEFESLFYGKQMPCTITKIDLAFAVNH